MYIQYSTNTYRRNRGVCINRQMDLATGIAFIVAKKPQHINRLDWDDVNTVFELSSKQ